MDEKIKIEKRMVPAYCWECPECGELNIDRLSPLDISMIPCSYCGEFCEPDDFNKIVNGD